MFWYLIWELDLLINFNLPYNVHANGEVEIYLQIERKKQSWQRTYIRCKIKKLHVSK